ncbi:hypothetical protein CFY91_09265 [Pseudomonas fluvialis]|uniref:Uncharacterized protein n=1 Tax=Pseudomonas fluvialis TaxID=1793966 RepID=A0ABQ2AWA1_9PSED|nr:hypothetical protein [Pseudomonas fluvialis]OXM40402.1 hypothetical protein CFY91_09265 [Pseudomonas fluvialis]GGH97300.1 hypothetical protein GCM10007363_30890 [Pseudomonas fluvialis]
MLKYLLNKLANNIFRQKHHARCQARAYPALGEIVVIHDALDFDSVATVIQVQQINDIWLSDEKSEVFRACGDWCANEFELSSMPIINPANGFSMINGVIDIEGGFYGLNGCGDTFNSDFI